jgi:hypothetical protein
MGSRGVGRNGAVYRGKNEGNEYARGPEVRSNVRLLTARGKVSLTYSSPDLPGACARSGKPRQIFATVEHRLVDADQLGIIPCRGIFGFVL